MSWIHVHVFPFGGFETLWFSRYCHHTKFKKKKFKLQQFFRFWTFFPGKTRFVGEKCIQIQHEQLTLKSIVYIPTVVGKYFCDELWYTSELYPHLPMWINHCLQISFLNLQQIMKIASHRFVVFHLHFPFHSFLSRERNLMNKPKIGEIFQSNIFLEKSVFQ